MLGPRLLRPLTPGEAHYLVEASATHYPDFIRVYIPSSPYQKLMDGMEPVEPIENSRSEAIFDESDFDRSLRRTRKAIKDYVLCNKFELFATFTFKENRQDITACKSRMSNWLKNQRKRKGKFEYLIVPEFHKDGESLHFHAALKGYMGQLKQSVNPHTGQPLKQKGRDVYEIPSYRLGFTNVEKINYKEDTSSRVAYYIQKYIKKGMPLFFGKNRYWVSRDLATPVIEDNPPEWYLHLKPDRENKNEYGLWLEFDINKHALLSLFTEQD